MIKSFRFKIIFRVLVLTATAILLAFLIYKTSFKALPVTLGLILLFQVISLIKFVEKTNKDLSRFFLSIKYDDTSQAFTSKGLGSSFNELKDSFNSVMEKLQETRSEKEARARYFNTIIQHVGVGLMAFRKDGSVDLINNSARKNLRIKSLRNIWDIQDSYPDFVDALVNLKHKEKKLVKIKRDSEIVYLSLFSHIFVLREEELTLVSIQDIQEELEEKEMEAWQNLIRVLTHEIMNSITPISSMTSTVLDMLRSGDNEKDNYQIDPEDIIDVVDALKTVHNRSQGLMNFVSTYRNMTLIPTPKFKLLPIGVFFKHVEKLMNSNLREQGIAFKWSVKPESLEFTADPDLMEQVIINLIINAVQALQGIENPCIHLSAYLDSKGKIAVTVEDNGIGIAAEALEKIFIPFFTTKKKGSGIGLSLSRQILRLHHATISVDSKPNNGAKFTLRFS